MKRFHRKSYTLLEVLTVVSLLGVFILLSGPLMLQLLNGLKIRTKMEDQLYQVSRISDQIRTDLDRQTHQSILVSPNLLHIVSTDRTIDYRIDNKTIERIETLAGKSPDSSIWKTPQSSLSFSSQPGENGFILVGLDWQLHNPKSRYSPGRTLSIPMDFAAQTAQLPASTKEAQQ
jgi:type II secretory pathway pseudopilin PulG